MVDPCGHGEEGLVAGAHGVALIARVEEPFAGKAPPPGLAVPPPFRDPEMTW